MARAQRVLFVAATIGVLRLAAACDSTYASTEITDASSDGATTTSDATTADSSIVANDATTNDGGTRPIDAALTSDASSGDGALTTGIWFVTSQTFTPSGAPPTSFASQGDADTICASLADGSSLPSLHGRKWRAWIGASNESAYVHVSAKSPQLYVRPDGLPLGTLAQMLNATNVALPNAPNITENGKPQDSYVWTGTHSDGTVDINCADWTLSTSADHTMTGLASALDSTWTHAMIATCNSGFALYCAEQL
jgi:hypothetical protein